MSKRSNKFINFLYNNSTQILCIACFLLANGFLMSYVIPFNLPIGGHDYSYHYLRVEALKYNIETGNMFSGVDYLYFGGGGYAGSAYPSLFLYIPALLRVMGLSIGSSMSVFIVICNMASYCFMYLFMRRISNSPVCGSVAAVLYVLSGYRLDNIIERFALGEVQAYVFWPIILYGLYDFIFCDFKKPYIIGAGFVGMLLSHTISTALALGYCVIISLVFIKRILKTPKKLLTLGITASCTVLVTAYYWMPLLELLTSCEMSVAISAYHTIDYVIPFTGLFKEIVHNGIAGMGFPIFLLCIPRMFLTSGSPVTKKYLLNSGGRRKRIFVIADASLILGLVSAVLSTSLVPWSLLSKVLDFMQFPWRFFAPSSLFLVIAGSVYIYYLARYTKAVKTVMITVTAAALLIAINHTVIAGIYHPEYREDDFYTGNAAETYHIGAGEWLPRAARGEGLDQIRLMGSRVILNGDGQWIHCERKNGKLTFDLKGRTDASAARLPFIWYKGYEGTDENGKKLDTYMSNNGLVMVDLRGAEGLITVEHKPTAIKTASYCVSAVSAAALAAAWVIRRYRKRKADKAAQ